MNEIKITFQQSKFELGDEIYAVCGPDNVVKSSIKYFQGLILKDRKKEIICFAKQADIGTFIFDKYFNDIDNCMVPLKYLTKNEEKALEWKKWYPVSMTEEWLEAIGDRDKQEDEVGNIEDGCELGICCANISEIRDVLYKCREKGGMIGWERENLQQRLDNSCHDKPETHTLLDKIFEQVGVEWKE